MAAADEEGGEEELRQVVSAMGYDKQLKLRQVCIVLWCTIPIQKGEWRGWESAVWVGGGGPGG